MLEDVIRKDQVSKEFVGAVFFDVEKAYDMMWRKWMFIIGIASNVLNWVRDFVLIGLFKWDRWWKYQGNTSLKMVHHREMWSIQLFFQL